MVNAMSQTGRTDGRVLHKDRSSADRKERLK